MTTLALVRHAKSDWDDPDLHDRDRPLSYRGRVDAPRMADLVATRVWRPSLILASPATRAAETADIFATALNVRVEYLDLLYGATAKEILGLVGAQASLDIMVVAHDPSLSVLAHHFEGDISHMPTCAVATFTWPEESWDGAFRGRPATFTYDIPREITVR